MIINRNIIPMLAVVAMSLLVSCTDTGNTSSTSATSSQDSTAQAATPATPQLAAPDCPITGEVLEGNKVWLQTPDLLVVIKADETTTTEEFGPSHRVLEILDGRSCERRHKTTLPENTSPDFPYYVAPIQYNNVSNVIGIQGYYDVFICDLANGYKLSKLNPRYFKERIRRPAIWHGTTLRGMGKLPAGLCAGHTFLCF
ncbi:MAG: hypothetical protein R2795_04515 [Saprospiraceae bacterium]